LRITIAFVFYIPPHSGNEYSPFGIEVMPSAGQKDGHHNIWWKKYALARLSLLAVSCSVVYTTFLTFLTL
jgi:hypothetical protein